MSGQQFAEELAQRLSVLVGMIMEDEVDGAISTASGGLAQLSEKVERLGQAGADIAALAAAAEVVIRRRDQG